MRSIVVGTDGSPSAEAAVRWAIDVAKRRDASVCVVTVFAHADSFSERLVSTARRERVDVRQAAENVVARAADKFEQAGIEVQTEAREGDPAEVIIEVAEQRDADRIIIGARGTTGLQRFLLGSVPSKVVHHAPCSVLVIRD